ncbi:MAG: glycosyltransferase family 2 protein [Candidatus Omnitrophica bacterium]|nr:glycosyltransferase family 2 protein [Candidatus Omnitrophota bacterium]
MNKKNITISICVPALNEEKNLEGAVEDLMLNLISHVRNFEIIIVDDGSIDSTPKLAKELSEKYYQVKFIKHSVNRGVGSCYRDALKAARGDYFTWFPSDHEDSAQELINCLPHLSKNCMIILNHRGYDCRSKFRQLLSYCYTWILNKYFKMNLKYYNGLTIIPTDILRLIPLAANGFAFSAEIIIHSIKSGCKVIELNAPLRKRASGSSKAFKINSLLRMCRDYFIFFKKENS